MPSVSPPLQSPAGPWNKLHKAALGGSTQRLVALLSDGSIDIDQGNPGGATSLVLASSMGHLHVVRILLSKGANVSIAGEGGGTALHLSAHAGHAAVSKMLTEAGADLEVRTSTQSDTPLVMAAEKGHLGVMSVLIEAGANPNCRSLSGATPLCFAAMGGNTAAIKMLLSAKANPLLTMTDESGQVVFPLGIAAQFGHLEVVRELVQQVGIEGCGGETGGVQALGVAGIKDHVDIMVALTEGGVVDDGKALGVAASYGGERSVNFLLQQKEDSASGEDAYVNYRDHLGRTPLLCAFGLAGLSSPFPRIVRLLVDAGANTSTAALVANTDGEVVSTITPLAFVSHMLREKTIKGEGATEEQLHKLERIRRLLLRVEAVYAVSFLWPIGIPSMIACTTEGTRKKVRASTPLRNMLPILRRRARRPTGLLAALFRNAQKDS